MVLCFGKVLGSKCFHLIFLLVLLLLPVPQSLLPCFLLCLVSSTPNYLDLC